MYGDKEVEGKRKRRYRRSDSNRRRIVAAHMAEKKP